MPRTKDPELEAQRRREVADAAIALLSETSWQKVTLARVAARAGVSKGVVTYWYASKDALLLAAIRRFHERYTEQLLAVATAPGDVRAKLTRLLEIAFPDRETLRQEAAFQAELWSYSKERPEARESIAASYRQFRVACEALLELGAVEGYVTTDQRDGLYLFVHALIDGVSLHLAFDDGVDVERTRERLQALLERWFTA